MHQNAAFQRRKYKKYFPPIPHPRRRLRRLLSNAETNPLQTTFLATGLLSTWLTTLFHSSAQTLSGCIRHISNAGSEVKPAQFLDE